MGLPDSSILTNILVPGRTKPAEMLFEKKYILIRGLENRLYTDDELTRLPEIHPAHPHAGEWAIRKRSASRLIRYLTARKKHPLRILEIGCGNGWLSHRLAGIPGSLVTGLDINFTELQQAARVFNDDPNLHFVQGDLRSGILDGKTFDAIVFAASVQYFPSFRKIVFLGLSMLNAGGEIHVLDTAFYRSGEIKEAERRTAAYYASLGYPEMADFYFHHSTDDWKYFHHSRLFVPKGIRNRLFGPADPFPWIRITN